MQNQHRILVLVIQAKYVDFAFGLYDALYHHGKVEIVPKVLSSVVEKLRDDAKCDSLWHDSDEVITVVTFEKSRTKEFKELVALSKQRNIGLELHSIHM